MPISRYLTACINLDYRTECNYRRECIFVAIMVGNNISALCNCGNDGGNYGFSKIII